MNYKTGFWVMTLILIIFCIFWWVNRTGTAPGSATFNESAELDKNLSGTVTAIGIKFKDDQVRVVNSATGEIVKPCKDGPVIVDGEENYPDIKQEKTKNKTSENSSDCLIQIVKPKPQLRNALEASNKIIEGIVNKEGTEISAKFLVVVTALYEGSICRTHHVGGNQHTLCIQETDLCEDMLEDAIYYDDQELIDEVKEDCEV